MKSLLSVLLLTTSTFTFAADLTIEVTNLKSDKGEVFIALWDGSRGFPKDYRTSMETKTFKAALPISSVTIENLPAGNYAIAVFHDKNSDTELNTNAFGIPKEGFGFSNNPRLYFGPPSFKKANIKIGTSDKTTKVILKYY